MSSTVAELPAFGGRRRVAVVSAALAVLVFVAVGLVGVDRYGWNYWLYRGFAPPRDPAYVTLQGTTTKIAVTSPALGGRTQTAYAYLPPGYTSHPHRRYPVLYLMHGFPGRPLAFLLTVRMGVLEDALAARHLISPPILVMPYGSTGTFTDKEWANGIRPRRGLGDVRGARPRAHGRRHVPHDSDRAPAVRSPACPRAGTARSTSACTIRASSTCSRAGPATSAPTTCRRSSAATLPCWNATRPLETIRRAAPALRRGHVYVWFYSGSEDPLRVQNAAFARELARLHVDHRYFVVRGGHNWAVWRTHAQAAPARRVAEARPCVARSGSPRSPAGFPSDSPSQPLRRGGCTSSARCGDVPGPRIGEALPLDELRQAGRLAARGLRRSCGPPPRPLLGLVARALRAERLTAALLLALGVGAWAYLTTGASIAVVRQIPPSDAFHAAASLRADLPPGGARRPRRRDRRPHPAA